MLDLVVPEGLAEQIGHMGWIFYPLLFCSLICVTIILERLVFFNKTKPIPLSMQIEEVLPSNRIIYYLASELVSIKDFPKEVREEMMAIAFSMIRRQLYTGIGMLKFIAAISPMMGLLGNVLGMIHSFTAISTSKTGINPVVVSGGLKEAMYVTAFGLIVAVPAMFSEYIFKYLAATRFDNYVSYITQQNILLESEKRQNKKSSTKTKKYPNGDEKSDEDDEDN